MTILVTGGTGFLGKAIISEFIRGSKQLTVVTRKETLIENQFIKNFKVESIDDNTEWSSHLLDIDCIVHTAARVHVMKDESLDPISEFRKTNTLGTLNLAKQAADSGVKRFILISSIKVNGESTMKGSKFSPTDVNVPCDPYGLSKYEAENGLREIAQKTGMEVVIIRPPLIYGPNVKANFRTMMKWVNKGVPLPFGSIHNKRSLIALTNLVDFIKVCISHPDAANETFLISDDIDVSTTELLTKIGQALNKRAKLISLPVSFMNLAARLIGRADVAARIFGNLQVDSSKARKLLNWTPLVTMEQELKKTAEAFLNE